MNPEAVRWLESLSETQLRTRFKSGCGRELFEIIDDHERDIYGRCWMCHPGRRVTFLAEAA